MPDVSTAPNPTSLTEAPPRLAQNLRMIEPLAAPEAYYNHFDGGQNTLRIPHADGSSAEYRLHTRHDFRGSSMSAVVLRNPDNGHAIIMFKGADLPGRNEGAGRMGFVGDVRVAFQSRRGEENHQTRDAEQAFLTTARDPQIRSLEMVGYSIGSIHANYMAARHGAVGTNMADMGLAQGVLTHAFNERSEGRPVPVDQIDQTMRENIVSLGMRADFLPRQFAGSEPRGSVVVLDQDSIRLGGAAHVPYFYMKAAQAMMAERERERPEPEAVPSDVPAPGPRQGPSSGPR